MKPYLVGIDEAGRGPLAGPVAVGVSVIRHDFDWGLLPGVDDSKKLSENRREQIYAAACQLRKEQFLTFTVATIGPGLIDDVGIAKAIPLAIRRALSRLSLQPADTRILLDGSLKAPPAYTDQMTIIGGDAIEPAISLASIVAKVTRDRFMKRIAQEPEYVAYKFDVHKGYGTKAHRAAISEHGLSSMHRRSYCKNVVLL